MEELIAQLSTIAQGMWRFRWQAVLVAWLVAMIGAATVYQIPDQYEASARVFVDTQSILKPLMSGLAVQPNVEQQVVMLSRTLISRPNVEKLVRMADLDLKSESKAQQEALIAKLTGALEIKNVGRDNLYVLAYRDTEPGRAQRVIQSLVSIFVESSLGATRKDTDTAKVFLAEQIKTYEAKLQEAEARLKDFKLRNIQMNIGEGKDSASRLAEFSEQLNQARLALREAEQARDSARAQLQAEKAQSGSSTVNLLLQESAVAVATPEIDARIEVQKRNLDGLLQRFTEQHPDVVSTKKLIQDLEEQKKKEVAQLRKAAMAAPTSGSPADTLAKQELGRMLAASEVMVASLKARVAEYSSRFNQARDSLKNAPQLDAEASQLNRDYLVNKKNYEDLVGRRESAVMSGDLDLAAGVADFRLIDPPRVSPKPVSPNRFVLLPLAMILAIASGLFTAFALSQMRPVFHSATELRNKVGLPLLGLVSRVVSEPETRRERGETMRFLLTSGGLVGLFAATLIAMAVMAARRG
jgi:polysaccharide chain length determinant protein (PEP-CTERM system associated)